MPNMEFIRFYHGESMTGTFKQGDCLTIILIGINEIHRGDVIVYKSPNNQGETDELVHRVIGIKLDHIITKGDNNPYPDTIYVTADNLVGRVKYVTRDGKKKLIMGGNPGLIYIRFLQLRRMVLTLIRRFGGSLYRWLRTNHLLIRIWCPEVKQIFFHTSEGDLVKYIYGGKTVATWWPRKKRFECKKPYDLVIPNPEEQNFPSSQQSSPGRRLW